MHKFQKDRIKYFLEVFSSLKDRVLFLFDNPKDNEVDELMFKSGINYFFNKVNKGKLLTLVDNSHNFNFSHVKIIDFDDSIDHFSIKDFIKKFDENIKGGQKNALVMHRPMFLTENNLHYSVQSLEKNIILEQKENCQNTNWQLPANFSLIYPTSALCELKQLGFCERLNYFNDDFLTLFTLSFNKNSYKFIDGDFYIHHLNHGQTSDGKIDRFNDYLYKYELLIKYTNTKTTFPRTKTMIKLIYKFWKEKLMAGEMTNGHDKRLENILDEIVDGNETMIEITNTTNLNLSDYQLDLLDDYIKNNSEKKFIYNGLNFNSVKEELRKKSLFHLNNSLCEIYDEYEPPISVKLIEVNQNSAIKEIDIIKILEGFENGY